MPKTKYVFCKDFDDLCTLVTDHIRNVDTGMDKNFGEINFQVENTPGAEAGSRMSQSELEEAYREATGVYGVKVINPFDLECTVVAVGYYGGTWMSTFKVDRDAGLFEYLPKLQAQVKEALYNALLANCDDWRRKNFLVEIKEAE